MPENQIILLTHQQKMKRKIHMRFKKANCMIKNGQP
jgi:hypothetical protein